MDAVRIGYYRSYSSPRSIREFVTTQPAGHVPLHRVSHAQAGSVAATPRDPSSFLNGVSDTGTL